MRKTHTDIIRPALSYHAASAMATKCVEVGTMIPIELINSIGQVENNRKNCPGISTKPHAGGHTPGFVTLINILLVIGGRYTVKYTKGIYAYLVWVDFR